MINETNKLLSNEKKKKSGQSSTKKSSFSVADHNEDGASKCLLEDEPNLIIYSLIKDIDFIVENNNIKQKTIPNINTYGVVDKTLESNARGHTKSHSHSHSFYANQQPTGSSILAYYQELL